MFVIGITGGIGCGKSTVAGICRQAGLDIIDADLISRKVTEPDGAAMPEIVEIFGSEVLDDDLGLDRNKMARKVFSDKKSLDLLGAIIHKHVVEQMQLQVKLLEEKKVKAVVLDVPIPVRHGFLDICDQVWVVWADDDIRLRRLEARGMQPEEAKRRIQMQMTKEEYQKLADREIDNSSSLDDLCLQVSTLLQQELSPRGIRFSMPCADKTEKSIG
jgi:dephospho-CoA kinase